MIVKLKPATAYFLCALIAFVCCQTDDFENVDFRNEMVKFVSALRSYAHDTLGAAGFGIFPQNGEDLVGESSYLNNVDGIGREDIYYGYAGDDQPTPPDVSAEIESALDIYKNNNRLVLTIDYATTASHIDDAYQKSHGKGYIPYVAVRQLNEIYDNGHMPGDTNSTDVHAWLDVKHFLYMLQYTDYNNIDSLIAAINNTYYDLLIIDYSFDGSDATRFTEPQVALLKTKPDGKRRMVIAYLSIGEAEVYRYYWQSNWEIGSPDFIFEENPDWPGNYKVFYWRPEWQAIIFEYLSKIIEAGFDGVYLDIVDAYEYFENM